VVAYDKNRAIGRDNKLPWGHDLPADLAHFKELTVGQSVIMGRKTYESIGRPLPNRQNIILSHNLEPAEGIVVVSDLEIAYRLAKNNIFIIGGSSIFVQAMDDLEVIYATEIQFGFDGVDSFFPELGHDWHEVAREHHLADSDNKYDFDFVVYQRN
jgi:dihydrofolate reductase